MVNFISSLLIRIDLLIVSYYKLCVHNNDKIPILSAKKILHFKRAEKKTTSKRKKTVKTASIEKKTHSV